MDLRDGRILNIMKLRNLIITITSLSSLMVAACSAPNLANRDEAGANTLAVGKVSGRSYTVASNQIQILFNNPWIKQSACIGSVEATNVCDVDAGSTPEQTDNNADARAINSVVANLIRQSAIDVVEGYLPQNIHLDVASQNLDNNRIIEALEFAIEKGVHVRFVGNRENDDFDFNNGSPDTENESSQNDQFKPVKDYDGSDVGFGDIAEALDEAYPIEYYSGGLITYKREYFPLENEKTEYDGNYGAYALLNPWQINRFFYSGRNNSTSTNLTGVSDFNLVNHTGQMHHKFMLVKTRKRDSAGLPVSSNGNPVIQYHTVTGSTNLTDNGYYRNNNNIIIFTEEREYVSTDVDGNGWPDVEEINLILLETTNGCPSTYSESRPCLYNTYKRQMNYLLSDYDDNYKPAYNASLQDYEFTSNITLDVYFSDYKSLSIIPMITNEVLKATDSIYFMAFSFSTSTYGNTSGIKLHEALGPKHPLKGLISVAGLLSPDRSENQLLMSALNSYAKIYEYDNGSQDPDYYLGANRLHHKVMMIDPCSSDAVTITGSANWSQTVDGRKETTATFDDPHAYTSGITSVNYTKGTHNNEDIIIIRSSEVAQIYYEKEFRYLVGKSGQVGLLGDLKLCN